MTEEPAWRGRSYVIGAVCLALGVIWLMPDISWASFVLVPQIFALLHRIFEAIAAVALLMIGSERSWSAMRRGPTQGHGRWC